LNYASAAAYHCHQFNLNHKETIDPICVGDETYIKIMGKHHFVFLFLSAQKRFITAYHLADNRDTLPAIIAMNETLRTADPDNPVTFITDGNPSYPSGIHFINAQSGNPKIYHHKVVGLQNLDNESKEFRPFKQLIERLNRTFKFHVRPAAGFASPNGAIALTTLFVTYYNFLRPHSSLEWMPPLYLPELDGIKTLQSKWAKILSLSFPKISPFS
jgi:transposase-like protein